MRDFTKSLVFKTVLHSVGCIEATPVPREKPSPLLGKVFSFATEERLAALLSRTDVLYLRVLCLLQAWDAPERPQQGT